MFRSNVSLLHTSWQRIEIQGLVNSSQFRFRTRRFADMQGAAISTLEGDGDALLYGKGLPQTAPAALNVVFLQLLANDLHELIGQYGDEQVTVDANFFMVVDRAQAKFGFETPEHGFQVGEHDVGAPQTLAVPVSLVAPQVVEAWMGKAGARLRLFCPAQFNRLFAGRVRQQFDGVMLTDAFAFFLESADALVDFVEALFGARFAASIGDLESVAPEFQPVLDVPNGGV